MALGVKNKAIIDLIERQVEIDKELRALGVRDLVGAYGELLAARALSVKPEKPITEGYDLKHPDYKRVQVKTRKLTIGRKGRIGTECRAVGFDPDKPNQFDWLFHIVLNPDYSVARAALASHAEVWPIILSYSNKIHFNATRSVPSSIDMTRQVADAAADLFDE